MKLDTDLLLKTLPKEYEKTIEKYSYLTSTASAPCVAVFGQFNHGKSTLLNALVGDDIFAASDKRETVKNKEYHSDSQSIIWLDTPGLDADPTQKDDDEANNGAFIKSDIILFVHNINTGELNKNEVKHIQSILENTSSYTKKIIVLTQIDQVQDQENLNKATQLIKDRLPDFEIFKVSAVRYQNGKQRNQDKLIELSGIPDLQKRILSLKESVEDNRKRTIEELKAKILTALVALQKDLSKKVHSMEKDYDNALKKFLKELNILGLSASGDKISSPIYNSLALGKEIGSSIGAFFGSIKRNT